MTKPKLVNNNSLNPLSRLEKRLEICKNHHNESIPNCNKIQESHNKINLELKVSLERKSKISDSKVKKKRTTNGTSVNRKKAKIAPEKVQSKQYFNDCLEATPNISLNVHSSEFPDIDLDTFDHNFSMSINEQELDGVLNNCCSQPSISNDLFAPTMSSDMIYSYKSSNQSKAEPVISNVSSKKFKIEENVPTPLFPPAEIPANSRLPPNLNVDYTSSLSYIEPTNANINYVSNVVPPVINAAKSDNIKYSSNMYSVNMPLAANQNASSYNYPYTTALNPMVVPELSSNQPSQQYFYQYVNFPSTGSNYSDLSTGNANSFQLPTMSSGWYNNPPSQQPIKQSLCKPQLAQQQLQQPLHQQQPPQQQQFSSAPSTTTSNYHSYPHFQMDAHVPPNHQLQCQPVFNNHYDTPFPTNQSYGLLAQQNMSNYNMIPDQSSYYYMDYSNVPPAANRNGSTANNLNMINQNDSQFIANHSNANICRNVYQSHCI